MNLRDDSWDEASLASFMSAAGKDAAEPDRVFLELLRVRSTHEFIAAQHSTLAHSPRRRTMIGSSFRLFLATAAAAVLAIIGLNLLNSSRDRVPFGEILANTARAQTLHFQLVSAGKTDEIWVQNPNQLRWNAADGTYKIAQGDRLWVIDEKQNRAAPGPAGFFQAQGGIDLLALLDVSADRAAIEAQAPGEQLAKDGKEYLVYRFDVGAPQKQVRLEARADAATRLLQSIEIQESGGTARELARMAMLAVNQPVAPEKFAVSETLTEDGRIGKIVDTQGIASVRPVLHSRWTPVRNQMLLKPGDWLRTDLRGANAVSLQLVPQTRVILGPGTQVELLKPNQIRLNYGELEISAAMKTKMEVLGPNQEKTVVQGTQRFRLQKDKLVLLSDEPLWLKGFKGATSNEAIGALIATVDGRNLPLTVGYHKVSVDIRDQIARTVIEESFVNHTDGLLEGVFHFPLPQDASISGFGMWIGDNLVEADVVEKQRAREIYETILREKRDPGLLEWTGGNIFKARVYPIFAHSEKRIKITYTQVLPVRGDRYRYSYALQSEMLKQHPLRELAIDVKINSAVKLKTVHSPTHETRHDKTAHSAHLEFTAQEYTPARDFEVVVEREADQAPVTVIPHRRGEDGYFMLQLTPPGPTAAAADRDVLPDGQPLQLLLLVDTSASMDAGQRANEVAFLSALASALTPKDAFNVAGCDVNCDWVFEKPMAADARHIASAQQFVGNRMSLGWTDLDKAFASACSQATAQTHVVYLGDGVVTTGDADPVAFGKRLRRLYTEKGKNAVFHAVALGSSFEPATLKTIASLGGGSFRRISGEQGPIAVALELLGEIARPGLRDLKVQFTGVRTARVYPEVLPNVPDGTQQIILGRYLPEGRDQAGEVFVTGVRGQEPVQFRARLVLKDAEEGNSFIPRLWARTHLDFLLEQGASPAIKDEIIALSEEYQIITPYTSLLVLESDADRERFKVKRRFQMRDGEKFFAEGRDNAQYELMQQQMRRAGAWRLGLRRDVLRHLAGLGRDARALQTQPQFGGGYFGRSAGGAGVGGPVSSSTPALGLEVLGSLDRSESVNEYLFDQEDRRVKLGDGDSDAKELTIAQAANQPQGESARSLRDLSKDLGDVQDFERDEAKREIALDESEVSGKPVTRGGFGWGMGGIAESAGEPASFGARFALVSGGRYRGFDRAPVANQWLDDIFPRLPAESGQKKLKTAWPAEAHAIAQSLLRSERLAQLSRGLSIRRSTESFDVRWGNLTERSVRIELVHVGRWITRAQSDGAATLVQWCDDKERGIWSEALLLGRIRKSTAGDRRAPLGLADFSLTSLEETYAAYVPTFEKVGNARVLLILKHPHDSKQETRINFDTQRRVIVSIESFNQGKRTLLTRFDDFVEAANCWWARKIEVIDGKDRRSSLTTQTIETLSPDAFEKQWQNSLTGRTAVPFVRQPLPAVDAAKNAAAQNKATFDDSMALLLHFANSQQWTRVDAHLQALEGLAKDKRGMRWLRAAILNISRRHEELKKQLSAEAEQLQKRPAADHETAALALFVYNKAHSILPANEMLLLLDTLRPIYERQPAHRQAMKHWLEMRANNLSLAGQTEAATQVSKQIAADYPHDMNAQYYYAQALVHIGEYPAAYAVIVGGLQREKEWRSDERDSMHSLYTQYLEAQGRFEELVDYAAGWMKDIPDSNNACAQYLSGLMRSGQDKKANETITQWIREGKIEGERPAPVMARLNAAIGLALGQGHRMYTNRIDEHWLKPLEELARFCLRQPTQLDTVNWLMTAYQFASTDNCRALRTTLAGIVADELPQLSVNSLVHYVRWLTPNDPALDKEAWRRISDGLRERWNESANPADKHQLGNILAQVLASYATVAEKLAFLHAQLKDGPAEHQAAYAQQLFNELLAQPWSVEYEDEAFSLITKLGDSADAGEQLLAHVQALYRLTDRMVEARYAARMAKVEHQEKLTRIELRKTQDDARKQARQGLADRLHEQARRLDKPLAQWLELERLHFTTLAQGDRKKIAADCWQLLDNAPKPENETALSSVFKDRLLAMLANLASRTDADRALVDRLQKHFEQMISERDEDDYWKLQLYRLLVVLDRPKDLEQSLRRWIGAENPQNRWRTALGYLCAEQGRVPEAIQLLEKVESTDELDPQAYRTLANWYMAVNQRDKHQRAQIAAFKSADEWRLSNALSQKLNPWFRRDGHLPSELDKDVMLMFAALFEKSASPQSYLWQLQRFYQATHDFRLLAVVADAVVGHSAGKIYPFVLGMQNVLNEVRDEATADSIIAHIATVRNRAKTDVDHRALDLLEMQVRRRAAEVKNQPGPHAAAALAAMQRAFKRTWSPGEPRAMADFLAGLGVITHKELAQEQLRELESLHRAEKPGSFDRLHIAHQWAAALNSYSRTSDAVAHLQSALDEFQLANKGVLPNLANNALTALISMLESQRHYDRGEKILLGHRKQPFPQQQFFWLTNRLYQLYTNAIQHDGEVSLGAGVKLYESVENAIRVDLGTTDHNQRTALIQQLCSVYRVAHGKKLARAQEDLRVFAFDRLPKILERQSIDQSTIAETVARTVHDLIGPAEGTLVLIAFVEKEPSWLRNTYQDGWSRFCYTIGQWRQEAKTLGAADGRLFEIVNRELRLDLQSRQYRNRTLYHRHYNYFWSEKSDAFARTAEDVLATRPQSGATAKYVADYLYIGLNHTARAIEILFAAHQQKLLDESGQYQLVDYLHQQSRFADSLPVLQPLVASRPLNLNYRVVLLRAYHRTEKKNEFQALLKETDALFHKDHRWNEPSMASLASICLECQTFEQAVAYYHELIPLHERTHPGRGIGNGTLSHYYSALAQSFAGLHKTPDAVEAASGAVVSWGATHRNRIHALETLKQVLRSSTDLAGYVAHLDKQCAKDGRENPIVRKALGQVYFDKGDYANAQTQLSLAFAVQPNDAETGKSLLACFDKRGDQVGAIEQALKLLQLSRRDITLYQELGQRYESQNQSHDAERAYTSIVEVLPNESEGHALLAEIREKQNRWPEAIPHWEQVARIRSLEPTGLLKLAAAQIQLKEWDQARATLRKAASRSWPDHFGDVLAQVRQLEQKIDK